MSSKSEEERVREREGLPADCVVLVHQGRLSEAPALPHGGGELLVVAVDVAASGDEVAVDLFAGCWTEPRLTQTLASVHDGDVVVRAGPVSDLDPQVQVEMLLAHQGRWVHAGTWPSLRENWPIIVAPTAWALLECRNIEEVAAQTGTPVQTHGALRSLVDAGLLQVGNELYWERRNKGMRHTAHVGQGGTVILADGREYSTPSAAITALGSPNSSGWKLWRRGDGVSLYELRETLDRSRR